MEDSSVVATYCCVERNLFVEHWSMVNCTKCNSQRTEVRL